MAPVSRKASASSSSSSSPSTPPKKTFDLSKLKSPIKKDAHLEKKGGANDKPHFSIFRPVYQEGERAGEETRNRIVRWRSRYHLKADADAAIRPLILKETPRWMPEPLKVFQAKIFSVVQARTILNALRAVEGEAGAIHLPQDVGDEEFETAKPAHLDVIPLLGDKLMLQGLTYPLLFHLKNLGFTYERGIEEANGVDAYTIAQADFDAASMTGLLNQWGWTYELYDAAA